jgi:hypothetical protein
VNDLTLFDARARSTDPETSWAAARSITPDALRANQSAVLQVLGKYGPMTDEQLADEYARCDWFAPQSPSGLRTRRHELQELGLVEDSGERARLRSGRQAIVWRAS